MSRAFVRESQQDASESLPERPVSPHPNLVTPEGLKQIEMQIRTLEAERQTARTEEDASALARIARDLRYWNQRKTTARVVEPPVSPDAVRFGVRVTMQFADGSEKSFRLVGEDEADPARGLLSWVSPLAQALGGQNVGDTVIVMSREAEIVRLEG
jgi:transcription elongation GreA/GreB family factor